MEKVGHLIHLLYVKMSETTYCQRNRDVILNRTKDYYKNDNERLRDNARDKYRKNRNLRKKNIKTGNMEKQIS